MWPDVVVRHVPLLQLPIMALKLEGHIFDFIKLLPMRSVRPLHIGLQFRSSRGDDEEPDPASPTSFLKVLFKL